MRRLRPLGVATLPSSSRPSSTAPQRRLTAKLPLGEGMGKGWVRVLGPCPLWELLVTNVHAVPPACVKYGDGLPGEKDRQPVWWLKTKLKTKRVRLLAFKSQVSDKMTRDTEIGQNQGHTAGKLQCGRAQWGPAVSEGTHPGRSPETGGTRLTCSGPLGPCLPMINTRRHLGKCPACRECWLWPVTCVVPVGPRVCRVWSDPRDPPKALQF